jgi:hypothetical protein
MPHLCSLAYIRTGGVRIALRQMCKRGHFTVPPLCIEPSYVRFHFMTNEVAVNAACCVLKMPMAPVVAPLGIVNCT